MNPNNLHKSMLMMLVICFSGFIESSQAQKFRQPEVDIGPWSLSGAGEFPVQTKTSRTRSIQSSGTGPVFIPKTNVRTLNRNFRVVDSGKGLKRRNFQNASGTSGEKVEIGTRLTTQKTTTSISTTNPDKITKKIKVTRKLVRESSTSSKPHRRFTAPTTDHVLGAMSEILSSTKASLKRVPLARDNIQIDSTEKNVNIKLAVEDENYPEYFKQRIKNVTEKTSFKKPLKPHRMLSLNKSTKVPVKNSVSPIRARVFSRQKSTSSEFVASTSSPNSTTKRVLSLPKPTKKTIISVSTLYEPPTTKSIASYATRPPARHLATEYSVNTEAEEVKQIDPPLREYFSSTRVLGSSMKYSSRFRNSDTALKSIKAVRYQPTVPSITTIPLELADNDLDRWREILPFAAELVHAPLDGEIMTQSPSQTVSIYEALAEVLSKPTESLNFSNSKSTDRTFLSETSSSSTTTSTTAKTTTTTTKTTSTSLPPKTTEDSKENTEQFIDLLQKLKNETDPLVKSANIFSLARKFHTNVTEADPVNNQIDLQEINFMETATKRKTVFPTESTTKLSIMDHALLTTRLTSNEELQLTTNPQSTSLFPILKGEDRFTTSRTDLSKEVWDNEIYNVLDGNLDKPSTSSESTVTSNSSFRTVSSTSLAPHAVEPSNVTSTANRATTIKYTTKPKTTATTESELPATATTDNFIEKNYKMLQKLLEVQSSTQKLSTTQITMKTTKHVPKITSTPTITRLLTTAPTVTVEVSTDLPQQNSKPFNKSTFSDTEDVAFLRQLASYINRQSPSLGTLKASTKTVSLPSITTTPKTKTSTTRLPTTFSDADDIAFLSSLRQYSKIINLTTERSGIANRILELALNRSPKSVEQETVVKSSVNADSADDIINQISQTRENIIMMNGILKENQDVALTPKLNKAEIDRTKQMLQNDIAQYNSDIKLLSLLVGKPASSLDISKLSLPNLGRPILPISTMLPTPVFETTSTEFNSLSEREKKILEALKQIQTTKALTTTTTTTERTKSVSKSQEALIAAILKQQGIGPNNQVTLNKISEQFPLKSLETTFRPFSPLPALTRQPRPILDGLAWLWKTWQETAPGPMSDLRQKIQPLGDTSDFDKTNKPTENSVNYQNVGDSLIYSGQGDQLIPGGILGAALGVTRAVTQFLGVAFSGAGQAFQTALSAGSSVPGSTVPENVKSYYSFSGR